MHIKPDTEWGGFEFCSGTEQIIDDSEVMLGPETTVDVPMLRELAED